MDQEKKCPAVWYTHCLINGPIRLREYKWFPFQNQKAMWVFAKFMAMVHDYLICYEQEYGIQYGTVTYTERK